MAGFQKKLPVLYLLIALSGLGYYYFAYELDRKNFYELIGIYSVLFLAFIWMIKQFPEQSKLIRISSLGFRLIFLLAIPGLSQDFYRFIWDGRMIWEGLNPYLYTPMSFLESGIIPVPEGKALIDGMGSLSAGNNTNYPPLNQLCFVIATAFSKTGILGSVVIMRLMIIAADIGTYYFGSKLLSKLDLSGNNILLYTLNPFIIIELTGNLHFEGIMIFFLVWALYLLHKGNWLLSALIFSCSISIKLIPLMFLPLLFQKLQLKSIRYYLVVGGITLLSFLPFYSAEFLANFMDTIGLWFQKFEFNASLYYIARAIGYTVRGYNEIAIIGSYIPIIVVVGILLLSLLRNNKQTGNLITAMVFGLTIYLFCSTTVHPWYISTLLAFAIFTRFRFVLLWSYMIMLSYWAYSNSGYQESMILISIEYMAVVIVFVLDVSQMRKKTDRPNQLSG